MSLCRSVLNLISNYTHSLHISLAHTHTYSNHSAGFNRGFAYIDYDTRDEAERAIAYMDEVSPLRYCARLFLICCRQREGIQPGYFPHFLTQAGNALVSTRRANSTVMSSRSPSSRHAVLPRRLLVVVNNIPSYLLSTAT